MESKKEIQKKNIYENIMKVNTKSHNNSVNKKNGKIKQSDKVTVKKDDLHIKNKNIKPKELKVNKTNLEKDNNIIGIDINIPKIKGFYNKPPNKNSKNNTLKKSNSEYLNVLTAYNQDITNLANKYDINNINSKYVSTRVTKFQPKTSLSFKSIKTFLAHFEIFISLYLKRIFQNFVERVKEYGKNNPKNNIQITCNNEYNNNSKYIPIVNLNNAHCELYCSINVNQNKLYNTIFNSNMSSSKKIEKNNSRKNRILIIDPECNNNIDNSNNSINNKSIYVHKRLSQKNKSDIINHIKKKSKILNINENKDKDKINNKLKSSSPIKEMNINLQKLNFSKINELNQYYLNQTLYNINNSNKFMKNSPLHFNQNQINSHHKKFNSFNIFGVNNTQVNFKKEKNQLKKIPSEKIGIYVRPTENKKIKEIKIPNKIISSDIIIDPSGNNSMNMKSDMNMISPRNIQYLNTLCNNKDEIKIKNIYINRRNNLKTNLLNYSIKRQYLSNISYDKKPNEILIKQIKTKDKKVFINIKYIDYTNSINIKKKKAYKYKLKSCHQNSIEIINNVIYYYQDSKNRIKMIDIFSFDNEKINKNDRIYKFVKYMKRLFLTTFLYRLLNYKLKNYKKSDIYHKMNYVDKKNLSKKIPTPKIDKNFKNDFKVKIRNLTSNNSNNNFFNKRKINKQLIKNNSNYISYSKEKLDNNKGILRKENKKVHIKTNSSVYNIRKNNLHN